MNRRRKQPDVQLGEAKASGANVVSDDDNSLLKRAVALLKYQHKVLTGAALQAAQGKDVSERLAAAGWSVVSVAKANLLGSLVQFVDLGNDFSNVPTLRLPAPKTLANPTATVADARSPAELKAEIVRRHARASVEIDDLLASTSEQSELTSQAIRQDAIQLLQDLWRDLSNSDFHELTPSLAFEREAAEPFASFSESLSPPWTGTVNELSKATWVLQILVALLDRKLILATEAKRFESIDTTPRLKGMVTLSGIWDSYPTLNRKQRADVKSALHYFKKTNPDYVEERQIPCRPGAKSHHRNEYAYPSDVAERAVRKVINRRRLT